MRKALLRVAGIGCEGCVAPSKEKLLKIKGVKAVHVAGPYVEVYYNEKDVTLSMLLKN
ncbi:MAG: hypothetical protein QXY49_03080 [Thermofilaceae archaeon]